MIPYTYLIVFTHPKTYQREYYYGVQYGTKSHPSNLWKSYFTSSSKVHYRLNKYGKNAFHHEIRRTFNSAEKARLWEEKVLKRMKVKESPEWLNMNDSIGPPIGFGEDNPFYGRHHSIETKRKISASKKKRYATDPEHRKRISEAQKNKDTSYITEDYRKKARDRMKGTNPFGDCSGVNNGMYGKHHNEETKKKLSQHMQKRSLLSNPMTGKTHDEKAKKMMSSFRKESKWIHKDGKTKAVNKKDLVFWLDAGWKLGRQ